MAEKTLVVKVRLDPELDAALKRYAKETERTVSQVIRLAVQQLLAKTLTVALLALLIAPTAFADPPPPPQPHGAFPAQTPDPAPLPSVFDTAKIAKDAAQLEAMLKQLSSTRFTPMCHRAHVRIPCVIHGATDPFTGAPYPAASADNWPRT